MLRGLHCLIEVRKMADPQHAASNQRPQLQFDLCKIGQRPLAADQQMRQVDRDIRGHQRIDVIAAHAARQLGKAGIDQCGMVAPHRQQRIGQSRIRTAPGIQRAELRDAAIGHDRFDGQHVAAHRAIAKRPPAAGIICRHPANGRARGGRDIDGEPQPVRFQRAVEIVKHDPRLHHNTAILDIQLQNTVEMHRVVEDEPGIHGLPGLRGAAAAPGYRNTLGPGRSQRDFDIIPAVRDRHTLRHDLVERCVRRVAPARKSVEQDVA